MPRYITKVALAIMGDRIEPGTEVELSAEEAARFSKEDLTLAGKLVAEESEEPAEDVALEDMSHLALKARAKELGLSQGGSKADLVERIQLHLDADDTDTEGGDADEEGEQGEGEDDTDTEGGDADEEGSIISE